jgi:hypothetical protein
MREAVKEVVCIRDAHIFFRSKTEGYVLHFSVVLLFVMFVVLYLTLFICKAVPLVLCHKKLYH